MGKVLKVTIADIAAKAGVSPATVSLALRDNPRIAVGTRRRVAEVARRLGYETNGAISVLMARIRTRRPFRYRGSIAGLLFWPSGADLRTGPLGAILAGVRRRAAALGYNFEEMRMVDPGMTPRRAEQILAARGINGIIVLPFPQRGPLAMPWSRYAAVEVGYTLTSPVLHRVATSHYDGVTVALRELASRGYRRPGIVLDRLINENVDRKWLAAFCAFQFENDQLSSAGVFMAMQEDGPTAFRSWLRRYRPDAIIAGRLPVRQWLAGAGRVGGKGIGLVMLSRHFCEPGWADTAYIDDQLEFVGEGAVDSVVAQFHRNETGIPAHAKEMLLMTRWVEGATVRPAPR